MYSFMLDEFSWIKDEFSLIRELNTKQRVFFKVILLILSTKYN